MRYTGRMKPLPLFVAVLLSGWILQARAADYFAAVDASPLTLWKKCTWLVICPGTSDDAQTHGLGARAGFWMEHEDGGKSGMELGYASLGSRSGSKDYLLSPGCLIFCQGATASWRNDARIAWLDLTGQVSMGRLTDIGKLSGKIGIYDAHVATTGTYTAGGPSYTRKVNSTGLAIGAAFSYPLSAGLSLAAHADVFFNVKVANPIDPGSNLSEMLLRLALGVEYDF